MDGTQPFVLCEDLIKIFKVGDLEVLALQGLNLQVERGELISIVGASGSGKSTLLNVLGGLDVPSAGTVQVGNWNLTRLSNRARMRYRREMVGFVWQQTGRNLIPYLTALENVELPMILAGRPNRKRARNLLSAVGLGERMRHRPQDMSGGEQQRVGIAVALANEPELVLADEPTGSLDSKTGTAMLDLFRQVRDEFGVTVIIVTHDPAVARAVDRYVEIQDGKLSTEVVRQQTEAAVAAALSGEFAFQKTGSGAGIGVDHGTHEAFALLDSAGRIKLPKEFTERLGRSSRVKMVFEGDRVVIEAPSEQKEVG